MLLRDVSAQIWTKRLRFSCNGRLGLTMHYDACVMI